jgi:hypothetical protein
LANAYLNIAEGILAQVRRPLTPREMLQLSYATGMVPWHLHGATQHKTLHARLSEDISQNLEASRFYRTSPGRFFLRALQDDPETPEALRAEYFAPPRRKELRREAVLTTFLRVLAKVAGSSPIIPLPKLKRQMSDGHYGYFPWAEISKSSELIPIHSFLVVHRNNEVLSFRCGKFNPDSDPLYGRRSIGLGGTVFAGDMDLLFDSFYGIVGNGIDDLAYGVGLPRRLAEKARYENQVRVKFGVMIRPEGNGHPYLHVVMAYECPAEFSPSKGALSVNDLRWIRADQAPNAIEDYDATSRYLLETRKLVDVLAGEGH